MTNKELIEKLHSIKGQAITGVSYIKTVDWTNDIPNQFVLHSPEWQLSLSDGRSVFVSANRLEDSHLDCEFLISEVSKATQADDVLIAPNSFQWTEILNKPIRRFSLWQRVFSASKLLGKEFNYRFQEHVQIIELLCGNSRLSLTLMAGDIGQMTFYPTGYLGDNVGVFFDKTICTSHTVYDLTMRMKMTYAFP